MSMIPRLERQLNAARREYHEVKRQRRAAALDAVLSGNQARFNELTTRHDAIRTTMSMLHMAIREAAEREGVRIQSRAAMTRDEWLRQLAPNLGLLLLEAGYQVPFSEYSIRMRRRQPAGEPGIGGWCSYKNSTHILPRNLRPTHRYQPNKKWLEEWNEARETFERERRAAMSDRDMAAKDAWEERFSTLVRKFGVEACYAPAAVN